MFEVLQFFEFHVYRKHVIRFFYSTVRGGGELLQIFAIFKMLHYVHVVFGIIFSYNSRTLFEPRDYAGKI